MRCRHWDGGACGHFFFSFYPWPGTVGFAVPSRKLPLSTIRRVALALPGVEEGMSYGTPAFRIRKKLIARLHQDGQSIMFKLGFEARDHLMRADPQTFFITEHYRNYPSVLARLDRLGVRDLGALLARAIDHATAKRVRSRPIRRA
jgi:hypothetical protein